MTENFSGDEFSFCATTGENQTRRTDWIIDSGASCHMCWERDVFLTYKKLSNSTVKLGNGRTVSAAGEGIVKLKVHRADGKEVTLKLHRVLHVPEMSVNLLSVKDVTDRGFRLMFTENSCQIQTESGKIVAEGVKRGNLYLLDGKSERAGSIDEAHVAHVPDRELWHFRLGHIGDTGLDKLCGGSISTRVVIKADCECTFCEGCAKGKQTRSTPKPLGEIRATRRLECIHSDVCGPVNVPSLTGKRYVITFTDDLTCRSDVMFMTKKSQALDCFKEYQALVEGPSGEQIGIKRYLMSQQIDHKETDAESPEQNGVAERLNRTLKDKARAMVAHVGLSKGLRAEAVNTANYLRNHSPCQTLRGHITPYEAWHGKKPI